MLLRLFPEAGMRFILYDQYNTLFEYKDPTNAVEEINHRVLLNIALGSVTAMTTLTLVSVCPREVLRSPCRRASLYLLLSLSHFTSRL